MSTPWYQDGLRFRCTRCGHCCTGAPGYVWLNDDEVRAIAERLALPLSEFRDFYTRQVGAERSLRERTNGDCVFYDAAVGCTIYEVRPRQCRSWPFWNSNVARPEDWQRTCRGCPGSGQGDLIPVEEITRRLQMIKL